MTNKNQNIVLHQLMDNAIDFLNQSIRDLRKKPKYSVIHFHAAIELILKSRLLEEHWSLVVSPRKDPDLSEFLSGSFVSVSLDDSINRINKIIPPGLNKQQIEAFKAITKHRNRMVHFFHSTGDEKEQASKIQEIVKLQLTSWYYLHILMLQQWKETYQPWRTKIGALDKNYETTFFIWRPSTMTVSPVSTRARQKDGSIRPAYHAPLMPASTKVELKKFISPNA